jgi:hypothetical protein
MGTDGETFFVTELTENIKNSGYQREGRSKYYRIISK